MSESLGTIQYGHKEEMVFLGREISEQRNYSEDIAVKIDGEVRRLIDEAYERATQLLTTHMAQLRGIAELLVEKETIEGAELETFFDAPRPKPQLVGPPVTEPALVASSIEESPAPAASDARAARDERQEPDAPPAGRLWPQPA